ncbi:hypothetical protein [Rhizorhabdus sp. FW153]|uniref:hypothetical protein n=1 Tax=Rhizorhabdus sp. FW153 TaxID=3400216 RepID=UPI003CFAB6E8
MPPRLLSLSVLILSTLAAPLAAQEEDAEHRADRLRTIELNREAQARVDARDRSNARVRETNRAAQERYERQREQWRRRVEACENGDYRACAR